MNNRILALIFAATVAFGPPARADDVTSQINEALTAYGKKDLPTAIAGLEAALNMMRQSRADSYGALLPAAPDGWKADAVETVSAGVALGGGGTSASRKYHKGSDLVTVSILTDSPLLPMMLAMTTGPLAAMSNLRTQVVNGRRATYQKDEGAFMIIVADKIMVRVEGRGQSEDTLKQFLTAIDFAAVEKVGK